MEAGSQEGSGQGAASGSGISEVNPGSVAMVRREGSRMMEKRARRKITAQKRALDLPRPHLSCNPSSTRLLGVRPPNAQPAPGGASMNPAVSTGHLTGARGPETLGLARR